MVCKIMKKMKIMKKKVSTMQSVGLTVTRQDKSVWVQKKSMDQPTRKMFPEAKIGTLWPFFIKKTLIMLGVTQSSKSIRLASNGREGGGGGGRGWCVNGFNL